MRRGRNNGGADRATGFVLPVVLVLLAVMTSLALYTIRRASVDERLAGNVRGLVLGDTGVSQVLRFCELWTSMSVPGFPTPAGMPNPPRTMLAPAAGNSAAWRVADNWTNNSVSLATAALAPGVDTGQCLIEDATAEIDSAMLNDPDASGQPASMGSAGLIRKFRITARAARDDGRVAHAQSEIRLFIGNSP